MGVVAPSGPTESARTTQGNRLEGRGTPAGSVARSENRSWSTERTCSVVILLVKDFVTSNFTRKPPLIFSLALVIIYFKKTSLIECMAVFYFSVYNSYHLTNKLFIILFIGSSNCFLKQFNRIVGSIINSCFLSY